MALSGNNLSMQLNDYRGLSAYEVAVKNGFEGNEKEWLASLKGEPGTDGDFITVNHKKSVDGNISVNGTDIYLYPGMSTPTVAGKIEELVDDLSETNDAVIKAQSAADRKAEIFTYIVDLPATSWIQDPETLLYSQSVAVNNITSDTDETSACVAPPTDRATEEKYNDCAVRASSQGDGSLVFTCTDLPDVDLNANVMVVVLGVSEG